MSSENFTGFRFRRRKEEPGTPRKAARSLWLSFKRAAVTHYADLARALGKLLDRLRMLTLGMFHKIKLTP